MEHYMVLVEILNTGCTAFFFQDFDAAIDFIDTQHHDDYFFELYERRERWAENHIEGFEYVRID